MKYLDLFASIGGFPLGIQQAYELSKVGIKSKNRTDSNVVAEIIKRMGCA